MDKLSPQPRYRLYTSLKDYKLIFQSLLSGKAEKGDFRRELEEMLRVAFHADHVLCISQARLGIYLAVKNLIKPGQGVILSPYTIADVVNMVICAGGIPVFADIQRESCNIDPSGIEKLIDDNTGAVMITHLHGLACEIDCILEMCKRKNVYLIEDAAQAFGTKYQNKYVGTFGDIGIFSFGLYKNITSFWGGVLVAKHEKIFKKIVNNQRYFKYFEMDRFLKKVLKGAMVDISTSPFIFPLLIEKIFRFGHLFNIRSINRFVETELDLNRKADIPENYLRKMMPLQAKLILNKFDKVDSDSMGRLEKARIYHENLRDIPELILPPLRTDLSHIYSYFPIQYHKRDHLLRWLVGHRRDIGKQHLKNCADLFSFKKYRRQCMNARKTSNDTILLPTYPGYPRREVNRNIEVIHDYFKKYPCL